jgi:NAD(P)-dependent dehydrogenase (short-subunit alcohol dehydrogenase family)
MRVMTGRFAGQVAMVTGAATGIGKATALRLAAEGASLVLTTSRNKDGLNATVAAARELGAQAVGRLADASQSTDVAKTTAEAVAKFGRLDVLVANAAYFQAPAPAAQLDEDEWDRTLDTGLKGVFLAAKYSIPAMLETAGKGTIVNVSSINSTLHAPGLPAYSAAKGGVDALTRQLALEYGPRGIRVNAVNPGLIAVEKVATFLEDNPDEAAVAAECYPLDRIGDPDDVARAIAFLASADAAFITGVTMPVDGGLSIQSAAALLRPGLRRGWRNELTGMRESRRDGRTGGSVQ